MPKTKIELKREYKLKIKRPGIHAKTKFSKSKNSKNYVKPYAAQGK